MSSWLIFTAVDVTQAQSRREEASKLSSEAVKLTTGIFQGLHFPFPSDSEVALLGAFSSLEQVVRCGRPLLVSEQPGAVQDLGCWVPASLQVRRWENINRSRALLWPWTAGNSDSVKLNIP